MTGTVLILGASGRFGRQATAAFMNAGWRVRRFRRGEDDLMRAAEGADVIVYGWNPAYTDWARDVPGQVAQVIAAARSARATVILPGNVYVLRPNAPFLLDETTPHRAENPLGRIRRDMETAFQRSGVQTIVLRSGDFLDTEASGNWFDLMMIKNLRKGRLTYPGPLDVPHGWAYLPDLSRAAVALAEKRAALGTFEDVPFPGYTVTGAEMAAVLSRVTGRDVRAGRMSWLPLRLARPFWPMARRLLEMRYLWSMPHQLGNARFAALLPGFRMTPIDAALASAIGHQVDPDQPMRGQVLPLDKAA